MWSDVSFNIMNQQINKYLRGILCKDAAQGTDWENRKNNNTSQV